MEYLLKVFLTTALFAELSSGLSILTVQSDKSETLGDGWGAWGEWQPCSRSCGGGVTYMKRECTIKKEGSEKGCVGEDKMYSSCSIQDCPVNSVDFREKQCSQFNNITRYRGSLRQWQPYYDKAPIYKPCALHCRPIDQPFEIVELSDKVIDGTRCRRDSFDTCVDGRCQEMGCDMIFGSNMKLDVCGECGGDGSTCKLSMGFFFASKLPRGSHSLLDIPAGATHIKIEEKRPSKNYFVIRDFSRNKIFRGNESRDVSNVVRASGVDIYYDKIFPKRNRKPADSIFILGPTAERLYIEVVLRERNRGISFEFYLPQHIISTPQVEWKVKVVGNCTKVCGGGTQRRKIKCNRNGWPVSFDYCSSLPRPKQWISCNEEECKLRWHVEEWQTCSKSCNGGIQSRHVYCVQESPLKYSAPLLMQESKCHDEKPVNQRVCNTESCPYWSAGEWSNCSTNCGYGTQKRDVFCTKQDHCNISNIPLIQRSCNLGPCGEVDWIFTEWSECTEGCGEGMKMRRVRCADANGLVYSDSTHCNQGSKPVEIHQCYSTRNCPDPPKWMTGQWSSCSVNCGNGIQTRRVVCSVFTEGVYRVFPDDQCLEASPSKKPTSIQNCTFPKCPAMWFTGTWSACSKSCGVGEKTRQVSCSNMYGTSTNTEDCDQDKKPSDIESCNQSECEIFDTETENCQASKYGCCLDGHSFSSGPNYLGCGNTIENDKIDIACSLPADQGTCRNWVVRYKFDPQEGSCVRFWYGGCDGNENRFTSEQECLNTCRNNDITETLSNTPNIEESSFRSLTKPTTTDETANNNKPDRCYMPSESGPCTGSYTRWRYDSAMDQCLELQYSGCGGNENNFGSRSSCLQICSPGTFQQATTTPVPVQDLNIVAGPDTVVAEVGQSVRLTCQAEGNPRPSVVWEHQNGTRVNLNRHSQLSDYSLFLKDVTLEDEGRYICRARNHYGYSRTRKVYLDVTNHELFIEKPSNVSVEEGETAVLNCRIASEVVFFTWHKQGVHIVNDERHNIQAWGDMYIYDVTQDDAGRYTCSVYTESVVKTASAELTVREKEQTRYAAAYRPSNSLRMIRLFSHSRKTATHCRDQPSRVDCALVIARNMCSSSIYRSYCCASCRRHPRHRTNSKIQSVFTR